MLCHLNLILELNCHPPRKGPQATGNLTQFTLPKQKARALGYNLKVARAAEESSSRYITEVERSAVGQR